MMFGSSSFTSAFDTSAPAGPTYIRAVPRRISSPAFSASEYHEITATTSRTKASLVAIAHDAKPDIPTSAFALEGFIVCAGGPGFSGLGFGGTPGPTRRFLIPFDRIPDGGSVDFEVGAPGLGQAGGKGYAAGSSYVTSSDYTWQISAEGGLPGQGSQEMQRSLHLWAAQNDVKISDLGQNTWSGDVMVVGPSSPDGPGAGAPTDYDTNAYSGIYGGYGSYISKFLDPMYACGDGGNPGSFVDDYAGAAGLFPGGGGGASGPSYPGGGGGAAVIRIAIVYMEPVE